MSYDKYVWKQTYLLVEAQRKLVPQNWLQILIRSHNITPQTHLQPYRMKFRFFTMGDMTPEIRPRNEKIKNRRFLPSSPASKDSNELSYVPLGAGYTPDQMMIM